MADLGAAAVILRDRDVLLMKREDSDPRAKLRNERIVQWKTPTMSRH